MSKALRQAAAAVTQRVDPTNPDAQRLEAVTGKATGVEAAVARFRDASLLYAQATCGLMQALAALYPPSGSLAQVLSESAASDGVFSERRAGARADVMAAALMPAAAGVKQLCSDIKQSMVAQLALEAEKEHYVTKVGRLHASFSDKGKLDSNRDKLRTSMTAASEHLEEIRKNLHRLDQDIAALLTPTYSQALMALQEYHTTASELLGQARAARARGAVAPAAAAAASAPAPTTTSRQVASPPPAAQLAAVRMSESPATFAQPHVALPAVAMSPLVPMTATTATAAPATSASAIGSRASAPAAPAAATAAAASQNARPVGRQYAVVEAEADFQAEADGDLSFRAGDLLLVVDDSKPWWTCVHGSSSALITGSTPSNYLRRLNPTDLQQRVQGSSTLQWAYEAVEAGELSVEEGERLKVLQQGEAWTLAEHPAGGCGFVPTAYLSPMVRRPPAATAPAAAALAPLRQQPAASTAAASAPQPPASVPVAAAPAKPSVGGAGGRGALLSAVQGFDKGHLKKSSPAKPAVTTTSGRGRR